MMQVKNLDTCLNVFDAERGKKAGDGLVAMVLARGVDDFNLVRHVFDITDAAKTKHLCLRQKRKKIMMSAGREGTPKIVFYKEAQ